LSGLNELLVALRHAVKYLQLNEAEVSIGSVSRCSDRILVHGNETRLQGEISGMVKIELLGVGDVRISSYIINKSSQDGHPRGGIHSRQISSMHMSTMNFFVINTAFLRDKIFVIRNPRRQKL
jgi:hypothetical protein